MLPPLVVEKLEKMAKRYDELEELVAKPEVIADPAQYRKYSIELGSLAKKVAKFREYQRISRELEDNDELRRSSDEDQEIRKLAEEEVEQLEPLREKLSGELVNMILVEGKDSDRNVIMEIRAGTGGNEAALFVADLYRMYSRYSEQVGWKIELLDGSPTDLGGYKSLVFSVTGEAVFRDLRYERGGHRVQRVPETEASGRIHTSAATVAVMGEAEEVEVEIKDTDLRVDFYCASGPGGQKVNKTSSAVRITHLPTGIVVAIQEESSQHKNRARAMRVLRSRIYENVEAERLKNEQNERRSQIGSGDRSQRIRTYNFPQNRVTDHRIGQNFNLEKVVHEGQLGPVFEALRTYDREQQLSRI